MNTVAGYELGREITRIAEAAEVELLNPLVYANYAAMGHAAMRRSLLSRNAPLRVTAPPLSLLRYPAGTLVNGDRSYLTLADGCIVREQLAPWCADSTDEARRMQAASPIGVESPCVLLARFGENTWGHWLTEMLVKAAIVEGVAPGRFKYAVPWWTTEQQATRSYAAAVLESLAAYGVEPERLVRLEGFQVYRFAALHDVAGTGNGVLHPMAVQALRGAVPTRRRIAKPRRLAVLRDTGVARAVFNAAQLRGMLKSAGFALADLRALPFSDQMRRFAEADIVVGSLGSDLAGLVFAPEGARVVSLAPAQWADGYFIRLFARLGAYHADVRGPSTLFGAEGGERAPHVTDPTALAEAIEAVQNPPSEGPDAVRVDGEMLPRRLGQAVLALSFGRDGNTRGLLAGAWSEPETAHCWSLGASSTLRVPRQALPALGELWLEIVGQGHVYPPHLPTRPLTVTANGKVAGNFEVIGRTRLFCLLTQAMLGAADTLDLVFAHPICPSPRMMGAGADDRNLGFGFETLTFYARADRPHP